MIGKKAYNNKTGIELGTVKGEDNYNWQIENKFGQPVSLAKTLIIFDENQAKRLQANPVQDKPSSAAPKPAERAAALYWNKTYPVKFAGGLIGMFESPQDKLAQIVNRANDEGFEVVQLVNVAVSSPAAYFLRLLISALTLFIWGPSTEMTLLTRKRAAA